MRALQAVDSSYRLNKRKPYQAVDKTGYEVELLVAPSLFYTLPKDEVFSPMAVFHEQEWLLRGRPVRHVVVDRENRTCPIFAPDPRWRPTANGCVRCARHWPSSATPKGATPLSTCAMPTATP